MRVDLLHLCSCTSHSIPFIKGTLNPGLKVLSDTELPLCTQKQYDNGIRFCGVVEKRSAFEERGFPEAFRRHTLLTPEPQSRTPESSGLPGL